MELQFLTDLRGGPPGDLGYAYDLGDKSGALDLSTYVFSSDTFHVRMVGDVALAVSGLPQIPVERTGSFTLVLEQDEVGGHDLTVTGILSDWGLRVPIEPTSGKITILVFQWTGKFWRYVLSGTAVQ